MSLKTYKFYFNYWRTTRFHRSTRSILDSQIVTILDEIVGARLVRTVQIHWNFNIRTVNIVYEHRLRYNH